MLLELFEKVPDTRRGQARKYDLPHMLLFSLVAILAWCNTYKDIEIYIRMHLTELNQYFGTERKKWPAHSTINYFFITLNTASLEKVFREHAKKLIWKSDEKTKWSIAFDGKAIRGSYDNQAEIPAIQMITSYLTKNDIILSHGFIEWHKTNEISVVQEMVKDLWLECFVITADALHCQKKPYKQQKNPEKKQ